MKMGSRDKFLVIYPRWEFHEVFLCKIMKNNGYIRKKHFPLPKIEYLQILGKEIVGI